MNGRADMLRTNAAGPMSLYRAGGRQPVTTARCATVGHGEPGIEPESDGPGPLASSLAGTVGIVFPDGPGLSTIDLGCWLRDLGLGSAADFGQGHRPMVAHKRLRSSQTKGAGPWIYALYGWSMVRRSASDVVGATA
jgi:hypothetical protein